MGYFRTLNCVVVVSLVISQFGGMGWAQDRDSEGYWTPMVAQEERTPPGVPATFTLPAGVPITAVLLEDVYSQRNREGDEVVLAVKDDVFVQGKLAIAKGNPILGKVSRIKPAKGWGVGGAIELEISSLWMPNGKSIPLTADTGAADIGLAGRYVRQAALSSDGISGRQTDGYGYDGSSFVPESVVVFVVAVGVVALGIVVVVIGSNAKGKRIRIPAGTEFTLYTAQDSVIPCVPEPELRDLVTGWHRDHVIKNFLGFSWEDKVTVEAAFEKAGYPIDPADIVITDVEGFKERLTVPAGEGTNAVFLFSPFEDVPRGAYKFTPLWPENDAAKKVMKSVR